MVLDYYSPNVIPIFRKLQEPIYMKNLLKKLWLFKLLLNVFAFFGRRNLFNGLTKLLTTSSAIITLIINDTNQLSKTNSLAEIWQSLMPMDGKHLFKISESGKEIETTEIHLHCPLRNTGDVLACYRLMNYDRKLMENFGGNLIVLESQSNSGKEYCKLAISKKGADVSNLIPAHLKLTHN